MRKTFTLAALVALAPVAAVACPTASLSEAEIRVAGLAYMAARGVDQPAELEELVDELDTQLVTCGTPAERQLSRNRIRLIAYRTETTTGLKADGLADYDAASNSWRLTDKGAEEVAIWCRVLKAPCSGTAPSVLSVTE